jgi:alpha-1,2-mannosyltransferase
MRRWTWQIAIGLVLVAPVPVHFLTAYAPADRMPDFLVYRSAGQSILQGRHVYEFLTGPHGLPFVYTPFGALLLIPPALVPALAGEILWTLLAIYLPLAVVIALVVREKALRLPLAVAACYLGPLVDLVRFGQIAMLLAALCAADVLVKEPRWPRGLLVGLATAIKMIPAIFIVHLWVTGQRRAALTAAGTAAAVTTVALAVLPGDSLGYWLSRCFNTDHRQPDGTPNQSLLGLVLRWHLPAPIGVLLWVAAAGAVAAVALKTVRRLDPIIGFAVTGLLGAMLSPITWSHHLVWIVVVLAVLVERGAKAGAVAVWVFFLPVSWLTLPLLTAVGAPLPLATAAYGLGALVLLLMLCGRSEPRPAELPVEVLV